MILSLPEPIAVVCNDAGAANIILSWLKREPKQVCPFMGGPAARLWQESFADFPMAASVESALRGARSLLSGTGWQSDLEHRSRRLARAAGVQSAAVLDHWTNYRERFVRGGQTVLPDEIWVTDVDALRLAQQTFPDIRVSMKPNLYLDEQVARIRALGGNSDRGDILYVAEPTRTDWGNGLAGELQVLEFFLAHRERVGIQSDTPVRLRPHPSDAVGKYDDWIGAQTDAKIDLDTSSGLAAAMAPAKWVVGAQSYALVVALVAGKRTISALPPWAPPCVLPHNGIIHLSELTEIEGKTCENGSNSHKPGIRSGSAAPYTRSSKSEVEQ